MRRRWIICILVIVILAGCYPLPTPVSTFTPANFRAIQSATFTPPSTATPQTISGYRKRCLEVEGPMPPGFLSGNALLFQDDLYLRGGDLYIVDDRTAGRQLFLADVRTPSVEISPNGYWIAYEIEDRNINKLTAIGLISADGQEKRSIPVRPRLSLQYWLDNERVVLVDYRLMRVVVLNVFTSQTTELDYSSYSTYLGEPPNYDPTLSRAVFHQTTETEGVARLVLWDVESGQKLWSWDVLATKCGAEGDAAWSPDGNQLVVGLQPEWPDPTGYSIRYLYTVSREGKIRQLTRYQKPQAEIRFLAWSPDGRYVAFWYGRFLAIFDTTTEVITDYCLSTYSPNSIRWSPDSHQVVIDTLCNQEDPCLAVVDVEKERAVEVRAGGDLIGWIRGLP